MKWANHAAAASVIALAMVPLCDGFSSGLRAPAPWATTTAHRCAASSLRMQAPAPNSGASRRLALKAMVGGLALTAGGGVKEAAAEEGGLFWALHSSFKASIEVVDSILYPDLRTGVTGSTKKELRGPLQPEFTKGLAAAIQEAALEEKLFASESELAEAEQLYVRKCVTFFPGAQDQLKVAGWDGGAVPWSTLWEGSEVLANMGLYARLHTISGRTPSPKSRLQFSQAVSRNVMKRGLVGAELDRYSTKDPRNDLLWLDGLKSLLASLQLAGYAVGTIGEGKYGKLDELEWREDGEASVQVFFYDYALIDAAQALAGEAQNDLAAALLPTQLIASLLRASNIQVSAEDFYIENTKNGYRPDGIVVQLNLQAA